jgi:hypothetical protein
LEIGEKKTGVWEEDGGIHLMVGREGKETGIEVGK